MNRAQQYEKQRKALQWYAEGKTIAQIQELTNYTVSMVFHIIKKAGVKSRRAQDYADDPDLGMSMNIFRSRPAAYKALMHADLLSGRPQTVLDADEYRRLGCNRTIRLRLKKFLARLNLTVLVNLYPALFDLKNNRYYRLTYRELVLLHAAPEQFLRSNADKIREGWRCKNEND
jgi:hypothetical protein